MSRSLKPPLPSRTLGYAKQLRKSVTDAEKKLWYYLRAKRFQASKWRRQHPVPPYVVDFYCAAARLVIELDGGQHCAERDAERTAYLESQGLRVLRFWDDQMLLETEVLLEMIYQVLQERTLSPNPSPDGRGEQMEQVR